MSADSLDEIEYTGLVNLVRDETEMNKLIDE